MSVFLLSEGAIDLFAERTYYRRNKMQSHTIGTIAYCNLWLCASQEAVVWMVLVAYIVIGHDHSPQLKTHTVKICAVIPPQTQMVLIMHSFGEILESSVSFLLMLSLDSHLAFFLLLWKHWETEHTWFSKHIFQNTVYSRLKAHFKPAV